MLIRLSCTQMERTPKLLFTCPYLKLFISQFQNNLQKTIWYARSPHFRLCWGRRRTRHVDKVGRGGRSSGTITKADWLYSLLNGKNSDFTQEQDMSVGTVHLADLTPHPIEVLPSCHTSLSHLTSARWFSRRCISIFSTSQLPGALIQI